ncbi:MAG: right-handed parallel beta-helix repeat-containing protein [Phycisphaerae bacterium]|nr:right-handed parallel beta-helix repeat-containing protein [Phycisphaerae bacterium]
MKQSFVLLFLTASCAFAAGPLLAPREGPATPTHGDILRARRVVVDSGVLASLQSGDRVTLPLFADTTVNGEVEAADVSSNGTIVVRGTVLGDVIGAFTLAQSGGRVSGSIWTSHGSYGLAPAEDGSADVLVQEWAPGSAIRCAMRDSRGLIPPGDARHAARYGVGYIARGGGPKMHAAPAVEDGPLPARGACACGDDQATIDVMFVYTTPAKNAAGGAAALQARINDAVASCNSAFAASGLNVGGVNRLTARVAGVAEISYDEVSPAWLDHLERLANPTDGFIDGAISLRDGARADTVCLIVDDTRFFGGAGYYAVYVRDAAAKVLNWRAIGAGSLTFAHELGHNLGCAHDRGNSSFSLFSYAWGHTFAANATTYGTLMSYTGAVFVPRFSNPLQTIPTGQPIGVGLDQPLPAYNALAISQTRWVLANHADSGRITDCNNNGLDDAADIAAGRSQDLNANCRPDECEYRIYVDASNSGPVDGQSWNTAFRDLGEAMTFAGLNCNNVSEVWVADGVYKPGRGSSDRYARFELRGGLALYGGFQGKSRPGGGETSLAQRHFVGAAAVYPTILSGDIGVPGTHTDNCFNVLAGEDIGSNAVLDGFTVERGYQDFAGAGLYLRDASPTIWRCVFRDNRGGDSGAIEVTGALASPVIEDCIFERNTALWSGGSIGVRGGAEAVFERCTFRDSSATYGGGAAVSFDGRATFRASSFTDNTAASNSGAIDCYVNTMLTLEGCELLRNRALDGSAGAVLLHSSSTGAFTDTAMRQNVCTGTGGAVWMENSSATFTRCELTDNRAGDGGGGFSAYGGGFVTFADGLIADNAARWGGGGAVGNAGFSIRTSRMHANAATAGNGGALDVFGAAGSSLISSALTANTSSDGGGGVSLGSGSGLLVINCTIAANRGGFSGGGIGMFGSVLTMGNSILWGNSVVVPGGASVMDQQLRVFSGTRTVNRSCVQGLTGQLGGSANISANPLLADAGAGDVRLLPGSACIDSGSNALLPAGADTDVYGNPRRADDPDTADTGVGTAPIVDRGAAEFTPVDVSCPADFNQDGGVDGSDVDAFFAAWEAGDAAADVNQDGGIDGSDVDTFFAAWEAGGC